MGEPTATVDTITLEVFRYRPEESSERTYQKYVVPYRTDWVVLDALNWIKDNVDGTLSYRWSCRMGVCGSCGMLVNDVPVLSCARFLREYYPNPIRIEPLDHFPVERDLMIEMESFLERLKSVHPWIIRREGEERSLDDGEHRQSPNQLAQFKQFSMCINCMLCYSACPVMALCPHLWRALRARWQQGVNRRPDHWRPGCTRSSPSRCPPRRTSRRRQPPG